MKTKQCLVLLLIFLCFSCKKKTDDACVTSTESISGTYKLISLKYKINPNAAEQDYLIYLDDCEKDDLIILKVNGTYTYQDTGTICTPDGSSSGTWSLTGSTINSDGLVDGIILSFDCSSLIYYVSDVYTAGDRLIFTIVKQ